jgi:hypothetical protein
LPSVIVSASISSTVSVSVSNAPSVFGMACSGCYGTCWHGGVASWCSLENNGNETACAGVATIEETPGSFACRVLGPPKPI